MALPVKAAEVVMVDERISIVETKVDHIQADVGEIKEDLRRLDGKVDGGFERLNTKMEDGFLRLDAKMDGGFQRLDTKMDDGFQRRDAKVDGGFQALNAKLDVMKDSISSAKLWAFGLYVGLGIALLVVLARGFKWI